MLDEAKKAIAARAVACPGWRRMERMRLIDSTGGAWTVLHVDADDGYTFAWSDTHHYAGQAPKDALPDLDDAATCGCLLALVREAMPGIGTGQLHARPTRDGWAMFACGMEIDDMRGAIEAEALVAALEAAGGAS